MSINHHFSSELPEAHWWTQQQQQKQPIMDYPSPTTPSSKPTSIWQHNRPNSATAAAPMYCATNQSASLGFNLNEDEDEEPLEDQAAEEEEKSGGDRQFLEDEIPKEAMFEKPLTPSDVGKLNRLVIPKQHAEKYFPLGGGGGTGDSGEKCLLLSFEDESGKPWRFRYSYWNSSQSYVLTKGWSRFVKEKRLDAGDVVLFERHRVESNRLFIGWRRRAAASIGVAQPSMVATSDSVGGGGGGGWTRMFYSGHPYPAHPNGPHLPYQPDCLHAGNQTTPSTTSGGNSKRLRLFGVNMECQPDDRPDPCTPDGSSGSNLGQTHHLQYNYHVGPTSHLHNHMDMNFSRDVMRYQQG